MMAHTKVSKATTPKDGVLHILKACLPSPGDTRMKTYSSCLWGIYAVLKSQECTNKNRNFASELIENSSGAVESQKKATSGQQGREGACLHLSL